MRHADYRDTIHLLNTAVVLLDRHRNGNRRDLRRKLRLLGRQLDLLRLRFGQPSARLQRN